MIGYVIFDLNDKVLLLSDPLRSKLGYAFDDSSPKRLNDFVVDISTVLKPVNGKACKRAGHIRLQSGESIEAMFTVRRISDESDHFAMDVDIEHEAAKSEEGNGKSSIDPGSFVFLTTVSHELRVSLNGVIGFANLLGSSGLNEDQVKILEKMQSCNFVLKGLINDILEYSRISSSDVDLNSESVLLTDFVREVVGLFYERARKKGIELRLELAEALPDRAKIPKLRVTQVLSNLISNAIKFTQSGWVCVSAGVDKQILRFTILDTGPGIPADDSERIFQPFVQSESSDRAVEGSGLGLAISKSLTERMNGSLYLERPSSGGSAFHFEIPLSSEKNLEPSVMPDEQARSVSPTEQRVDRDSRRVLIVEDNKLNADILSHFLREYGVEFDIVDNGRSAVEVYEDGKYDLILMDVMLPEMNGYEATERILALSKRADTLPIIGVTAKVFRRDQMRCLEAGMVEVVHKPVDFDVLGAALDRYLYGTSEKGASKGVPVSESGDPPSANPTEAIDRDSCLDSTVLGDYVSRMSTGANSSRDVLDTALTIIDEEIECLIDALNEGNREDVSLRSHSLKGALALLGSKNLLDLAKGLELVSSQGSEPLRSEHWKALIKDGYHSFRTAVTGYMAQVK